MNWETFEAECLAFVRVSDAHGDGWKWVVADEGVKYRAYLHKERCFRAVDVDVDLDADVELDGGDQSPAGADPKELLRAGSDNGEDEHAGEEDPGEVAALPGGGPVKEATYYCYSFSVVFVASYQVPALFFTVCDAGGAPVSTDDVWRSIPRQYRASAGMDRWSFVTQREHPVTGRPCYMLHPCGTDQLLKLVGESRGDGSAVHDGGGSSGNRKTNIVATWLSTAGPIAGLTLPYFYFLPASH